MGLSSNVFDTALLFEGGGMRVSYTAAVIRVLLEAGIHFDYVAGISAGSTNTVNYLSRDADRGQRAFVDFAADPKFGDVQTFLRGQGLFNSRYLYLESVQPGQALPYDFSTFLANPAQFRIGSFECASGRTVYWSRAETATLMDLMVRVQASSSLPLVMPPVLIGDELHVDGGIGESAGIPLDVARADGFEKFLVILSRERDFVKRPERYLGVYRAPFRRYPAVLDAIATRWQRYNEVREDLFELERQGKAMLFIPEQMPVHSGEKNVVRLRNSYELGLAQARRELPRWLEFLGLPATTGPVRSRAADQGRTGTR